jgi:cbb3-type cytochrome oxidase subunit 3
MDPHDKELLERQFRVVNQNERGDSMMALTILTVLFAALTIGGFVYAYNSRSMQTASNGTMSIAALIDQAQQGTHTR